VGTIRLIMPIELTLKESEILNLVKHGYKDREIAERMDIAISTVKRHLQDIANKLGTDNRVQAVVEGLRRGYITLDDWS